MPAPELHRVWTDIALQPDARALLTGQVALIGPGVDSSIKDPLGRIEDAEAAIVGEIFPGTAETFARAPRLRIVARAGIGFDSIDLAAATAAGIGVLNTPDAPTESTAEMAVSFMFALARKIIPANQHTRTGDWRASGPLVGFDLTGKTIGLVGFGRIGRRVAEIISGLRAHVVAHDPYIDQTEITRHGVEAVADLAQLFSRADIVSLHTPLNEKTRRIIDASLLAKLRPGAVLINTSRGGVIDEAALIHALQQKALAAAALDVFDPEPPRPDNPLLAMDNVIATAHVAAATVEGRRRSHVTAAQQVLTALRGEPTANIVNGWVPRRVDPRPA